MEMAAWPKNARFWSLPLQSAEGAGVLLGGGSVGVPPAVSVGLGLPVAGSVGRSDPEAAGPVGDELGVAPPLVGPADSPPLQAATRARVATMAKTRTEGRGRRESARPARARITARA